MTRRAVSLLSGLLLLLAAGTASGESGRDVAGSIDLAGRTRTYLLHPPASNDTKRPRPLVIVLHGGGGNAQGAANMTGFSSLADRKGFLVVYPNGTGLFSKRLLTWNSGNCCGFAMEHNVDDTAFVRALIAALSRNWPIDPRRIFATGISNGGMMSYRLACETADLVAAVAPVAGAWNVEPCSPARPVSIIAFHGTADEHVLYGGGRPHKQVNRHPRVDRSVADAISFWARQDRCPEAPVHTEKGSIARDLYSPCRDGTAVELVTIQGGGHVWPGGQKWAPWADEPTREISATEAMWEFFEKHPKPTP